MTDGTGTGANDAEAIGESIARRVGDRLARFEERMAGVEEELQAEVGRVRSSAQAIDLLADEVRRALRDGRDDDALFERIAALERAVREDRPSAPAPDLAPVHATLAEVLETVAGDAARAEADRRALRGELEAVRRDIGAATADLGPIDLTPVTTGIDELRATITATPTVDLGPIHQAIQDLASSIDDNQPQPVDLTPITTGIDELRSTTAATIRDATPTVDLTPLHNAIDRLAGQIDDNQPQPTDLTPITTAVTDLADRVAATPTIDLGPIHRAIEDLRIQVEQTRPEPTDLEPVHVRLDALADHVTASAPRPVDLAGVTSSIVGLHQRIDALTSQPAIDLTPVHEALAELIDAQRVALGPIDERLAMLAEGRQIEDLSRRVESSVTDLNGLHAAIDALGRQVAEQQPDLTPVAARFDALETAIEHARPEPTDLAPLSAAIADLRAHLADSRPDLAPLHAQLTSIAERVDQSTVEQRLEDLARTTDVSTLRQGVAEVIEAGAAQLEATERSARSLRSAIDAMAAAEPSPPDLDPVVRAIDSLRSHYDATQPDLDALIGAMTTLRSQILGAIESATAAHAVDVAPIVAQLVDGHQASESTLGSLRSQLEVLARTVDSIRSETRTSAEHLAVAAATVDIEPLRRSVDDLRAAIPAPVDLQPLREAIAHLADEIPPATDIGPVLAAISDVAGTIPPPADLGPVQAEVASVHDAVRSIDLAPLHERLETLPSHFPTLDLRPVEQALDTLRESMPATADLAPVHEAIAALRADLPQLDLGPVRRDVDDLRSTVAASQPDLSPIRESLSEVLDSLAQGITESRNATERVVGAVAGIEIPPAPDLAAARTDLTPVLAAIDGIDRRLDDTGATDRLRDAVRQVADDVASARADLAPSAAVEDLASRLDALQSAVDSLRSDDSLRETELRLARRVDTNTEALRTKIDDQRALADSLAANVSQLNAALTVASEEPQQLRRDLDRILEQLAERMGGAMRELRNQLQSAEEPVALRSSVEAGLDRITGRFQTDTGRILEAVSAAQDDADGRLRRIDNQVTELRRAVERVRRDTDRFDVVSPS